MGSPSVSTVLEGQTQKSLTVADFIDSGDRETEIRQLVEVVEKAADLNSGGKVFIGTSSAIITSPEENLSVLEPVIIQFAFARGVSVFISNYFERITVVSDEIKKIQRLSKEFDRNPRSVSDSQTALSKISAECVLMAEISQFLKNSLINAIEEYTAFVDFTSDAQMELAQHLGTKLSLNSSLKRVDDIFHLITGLKYDVNNLRDQISVIQEKRLQQIFRSIKETGQIQKRMSKSAERQDCHLDRISYRNFKYLKTYDSQSF